MPKRRQTQYAAVDPDRVYVTGFELGGYGTWYLAASAPKRFAAIVPISGFPKNEDRERLDWLKGMGIWAYHGTNEQTAKLSVVREMIERHWNEGGSARLTVYPEKHHESWASPYRNPELYEWIGRQARRPALKTQWPESPPAAGDQVAGRFAAPSGIEADYWLYLPAEYDPAAARTWPLLVFLHDTGRNASEVAFDTHTGIQELIDEGEHFPFIVLSPECRRGESWEPSALLALLDHIQTEFRIDPHRVTLTGIGSGGDATWNVAAVEPDRFAAIAPVESIPTGVHRSLVHYLRNVAIWAFHSDKTEASRFSYGASVNDFLRDKGKAARLTLYDAASDEVGDEPYKNPALYRWLETQKRELQWPRTSEWEGDLRNVFPPPRRAVGLFRSLTCRAESGRYSEKPMRYRLFEPEPIEPGAKYPLIVWLHGHGDEELKLEAGEVKYIDLIFDCPGEPERYPFYVLAPQCPEDQGWFDKADWNSGETPERETDEPIAMVLKMLDATIRKAPIDVDRISLVGISSGARACWELAMRYPDRFAAIAPMGSTGGDLSRASRLEHVSVWAFHSVFDNHPIDGDRQMIAAIRRVGGNVRYTEIPTGNHYCWYDAFQDFGLLEWLIEVKR